MCSFRSNRRSFRANVSRHSRATPQNSSSQTLELRSKIVLACATGDRTQGGIAAALGCNPSTVGKWRHRFAAELLDGLVDAPRPGAAPTIGDDVIEAVIVETLETTPPDATHWSTRARRPATGSPTPP